MSAIAEKPRKKRVSAFSHRKVDPAYYWMTVPAMILFMVFLYWPFLRGVMYSFTNSKGYGKYKWIGLTNYKAMFQDERIGRAYLFTFFIAIVVTILVNLLSMFIAVLLNSKIAFRNGFRAIYFIPYTLAVLVVGYVFKYIFMMPIPELGKALGIGWLSESMITSESLAWAPIVVLSVWQGVAYTTLIYLAGLQTIDDEIYEAAAIDGAGPARQFFSITLPMITPTILFNLITSIISSFQQVTLVMLLTNGGPMKSTYFYGLMTYNNAFKFHKLGYASANAWVMFIIILLLSALVFKSSDTWVFYESTANKNKAKKGKKAKGKEVAR